jgi:hypothetical protein
MRTISEAQRDVMDEARDVGRRLNEEPPGERFHYRRSGNLTQTKLSVQKTTDPSIDWRRICSQQVWM